MMSLFCTNICSFGNCGLHFKDTYDLIQHIEESHIGSSEDYIKKQSEQQISAVPLSHICRVFRELPSEKAKPITPEPTVLPSVSLPKRRPWPSLTHSLQPNRTITNTGIINPGSPGDLDVSRPGASDDSFHYPDYSSLDDSASSSYSKLKSVSGEQQEKRYACPVQGCNKRYKNINGVRIHAKTAHANTTDIAGSPNRPFKCQICSKTYKSAQSLQNHVHQTHPSAVSSSSSSSMDTSSSPHPLAGAGSKVRGATHPGGVTLITAPPSKGTTTIHVSPAPSPAPNQPHAATMAAAVAGGHQYHQQASTYVSYQPSVRVSSGPGGQQFSVPTVVSRSTPGGGMKKLSTSGGGVPVRGAGGGGGRQHISGILLQNPPSSSSYGGGNQQTYPDPPAGPDK